MYGLINRAVKGLVTEQFGSEAWDRIRVRAGVEEEDFISMESYDDSVTYDLVAAATEELGLDASTILEAFGGYWVEYTAVEGYGELLNSVGDTLPEFSLEPRPDACPRQDGLSRSEAAAVPGRRRDRRGTRSSLLQPSARARPAGGWAREGARGTIRQAGGRRAHACGRR